MTADSMGAPRRGDYARERLRLAFSRAQVVVPVCAEAPPATVSVVVPCYNYGHYLPTAVASILEQSRVRVEVVIVDDSSPDGSVEVARALAAADPRVTVVEHAVNRGHIATYNDGLSRVTGEFTVLMSADDRLVPGSLARAVDLMRARPDVGMVYGAAVDFTDEPPPVTTRASAWAVWSGADWYRARAHAGTNVIRSPEVVLRTAVQRQIDGYDAALPHAGDLDMWLRAASVASVGRVVGSAQAFYRVHASNMHTARFERDSANGMMVDLEQRLAAFDAAERFARSELADAEELTHAAHRTLAVEALTLAARAHWWGHAERWPVEQLEEFALRTDPDARETRAFRILVRSRRRSRAWTLASELTDRVRCDRTEWRRVRLGL
jgi:GT2 family glycosyltransferase